MQKSVFAARLSRGGLQRLAAALRGLELKTGFIKIYALAAQAQPIVVDEAPPSPEDLYAFII